MAKRKTWQMVDLHISQQDTHRIILALEDLKTRVRPRAISEFDKLIDYVAGKLKEAQTPTEVDRLIHKIAKWD